MEIYRLSFKNLFSSFFTRKRFVFYVVTIALLFSHDDVLPLQYTLLIFFHFIKCKTPFVDSNIISHICDLLEAPILFSNKAYGLSLALHQHNKYLKLSSVLARPFMHNSTFVIIQGLLLYFSGCMYYLELPTNYISINCLVNAHDSQTMVVHFSLKQFTHS